MKKLLDQISAIIIGEQERTLELRELKLQFLRKEKEMLRSIQLCRKSGGVIGIYSPVLGKGMFLCSVLQILQDKTLVIRPIDPNGAILSKTLLDLSEVVSICPFNQVYNREHEVSTKDEVSPSQLNMFQNVN